MTTPGPAPARSRRRARSVADGRLRRASVLGVAALTVLAAAGEPAAGATPTAVVDLQVRASPGYASARAPQARASAGAPQADPSAGVPAGYPSGGVSRGSDGAYALPVDGGVVERFRGPTQRWAAGHRGVDLAASAGTPVGSPAAGTVTFVGTVVDRAVVTVTHPDGLRSSLEPVVADVAVGDVVRRGDVVGQVQAAPARSHCAPRCLHWGVRDRAGYLDPLDLLPGAAPVVLLPDS